MEAIMRALYDYNGHVRIWLRNDAKWFVDSHGNALAFIDEGSIYNLKGCHVAWGEEIEFGITMETWSSLRTTFNISKRKNRPGQSAHLRY
jgi:4-fold beta-flower domain-containing protein